MNMDIIGQCTNVYQAHKLKCIFRFLKNVWQEVLMGRADYFESFKQNADGFICSILPGLAHTEVQYSPGNDIFFPTFNIFYIF